MLEHNREQGIGRREEGKRGKRELNTKSQRH